MSSAPSRNNLIRLPCSLKTEAKKRHPCWQHVRATCSVYEAEPVNTSGQSVSPPMGKRPSEGDRLHWPEACVSHWLYVLTTNNELLQKLHKFPRQGDSCPHSSRLKWFFPHLASWTPPRHTPQCHLSQFLSDHSTDPELFQCFKQCSTSFTVYIRLILDITRGHRGTCWQSSFHFSRNKDSEMLLDSLKADKWTFLLRLFRYMCFYSQQWEV